MCAATPVTRERAARAFEAVICVGAVRPTYGFLFSVSSRLWSTWREEHDRDLFARLARVGGVTADRVADVLIGLARMSIRTGKTLAQLTCDDLLEFRTAVAFGPSDDPNLVPYLVRVRRLRDGCHGERSA